MILVLCSLNDSDNGLQLHVCFPGLVLLPAWSVLAVKHSGTAILDCDVTWPQRKVRKQCTLFRATK